MKRLIIVSFFLFFCFGAEGQAIDLLQRGSDGRYSGGERIEGLTSLNSVAGYAVLQSQNTTRVSEPSSIDIFSIVLTMQPQQDVVMNISVSNSDDLNVDVEQIIFGVDDWNSQRIIHVLAIDDHIIEGTEQVTITISIDEQASDPAFANLLPTDIMVDIIDDDFAGFSVVDNGGIYLNESGTTAMFYVALTAQPLDDVVINIGVEDDTEVVSSISSLVFTSDNWNNQQVVPLMGVDDFSVDGNVLSEVIVSVDNNQSDTAFQNVSPYSLEITTVDNDNAGFVVTESGATTTVSENGSSDEVTVRLTAQPIDDVVLILSQNDLSEIQLVSNEYTFTNYNWDLPQTIRVTGLDDEYLDSDQQTLVTVAVDDNRSDDAFDGVENQQLTITTQDNDIASCVVAETDDTTLVDESGTADRFSIVLGSRPLSDVVFNVVVEDATEVTCSPQTVVFTTLNWNQEKIITISGVDDMIDDGDVVSRIQLIIDRELTNDLYDNLEVDAIDVVTTDNDHSPVVTPNQIFSVHENWGGIVGRVEATDEDENTVFSIWTIISNVDIDNDGEMAFEIDTSTGVVNVNDVDDLDCEESNFLTVGIVVADGANLSNPETVEINLIDVNEFRPVVAEGQVYSVDENLAEHTVVGQIIATDEDVTASFNNWQITDGNTGDAFKIVGTSGELQVNNSEAIDFETNPSFELSVTVSDGEFTSSVEIVRVQLRDVFEKLNQTISFSMVDEATYGDRNIPLEASSDSNLSVEFTSSNEAVARIDHDELIIVGAGSCEIVASQSGNDTYNAATNVVQELTVNKARLQALVHDKLRTYGASNPEWTVMYLGFKNDDDETSIADAPVTSCNADERSNVGIYPITITGGSDENYDLDLTNGLLIVMKATLEVNPKDASRVYGEVNPELGFECSGFMNNDCENDLDRLPVVYVNAEQYSDAGVYPIVTSLGMDNNYAFHYNIGALTVAKAELEATFVDTSREYGRPNPEIELSYSGFLHTDSSEDIDWEPEPVIDATAVSDVGTYEITAHGGYDNNYIINTNPGTLTITKAVLNFIPDDRERVYGDNNPELSHHCVGFVNDDTHEDIDQLPSLNCEATVASNSGIYNIEASGGSDNNYQLSLFSGTLTVTKATLQVVPSDTSRVYGSSNPQLRFVCTGFKNDDCQQDVDLLPSVGVVADKTTSVGVYDIVSSGGDDNNYDFEYHTGKLTIRKAQLYASVNSAIKTYGSENPQFSFSYNGFLNSDNESDIDTPPIAITTASSNSDVGFYLVEADGAEDNNYEFVYTSGLLEVVPSSQMITFDLIESIIATNPPILLNAEASSGLKVAYSSSDSTVASIRDGELAFHRIGVVDIIATQAGNHNFIAATPVVKTLEVEGNYALEPTISLYPNPSRSILHVELNPKLKGDIIIEIIGTTGKIVLSKSFRLPTTIEIDVSYLKSGSYMLTTRNNIGICAARWIKL